MTTPAGDREGLAPLPPVAPGDVPAGSADLWGGDAAVGAACADREGRLAHDEAQLRMPFAEQPHGIAIQT
jgi:hypothetical protein